jgi:hypothetical protein
MHERRRFIRPPSNIRSHSGVCCPIVPRRHAMMCSRGGGLFLSFEADLVLDETGRRIGIRASLRLRSKTRLEAGRPRISR